MRLHGSIAATCVLVALSSSPALAQSDTAATPPVDTGRTDIRNMVARLDLQKYKATVKGLTQFGDRRQGTDRNRAAVDWIEAQLKSYGCTPTERVKYIYKPVRRDTAGRGAAGAGRGGAGAATLSAEAQPGPVEAARVAVEDEETPRRAADDCGEYGREPASIRIL